MNEDQWILVVSLAAICVSMCVLAVLAAQITNIRERTRREQEWTEQLITSGVTRHVQLTPEEIVRRYG